MAFDGKKQREILGRFATGVTIVSTTTGDSTWGMTANAVTSLSLDPPLVLVCVIKDSQTHTILKESKCFAVNILGEDQEEISNRFASSGPKDFSDFETKTAETGAPILANTLGWVDCRLHEIQPGGDHDIFIGEVVDGEASDGRPLLFFGGKYGKIAD